jgi:FixJ family two-component response regulator
MFLGHVFLIEDDPGMRATLTDLLQFAGYQVRSWDNANEFLSELPVSAPAVILTDMRMPGLSGVEMHAELLQRGRSFPVIYLSGESTVPQTIKAMKLGAFDFLTKPFSREELLSVVASALERDRMALQALVHKARNDQALASLSPRERQVHDLLLKGFGNAQILQELGVSLPTAKQYKAEVMRKLGVRSLAELIARSTSSRAQSGSSSAQLSSALSAASTERP